MMAHALKPDSVFQRNGRVQLYRPWCQFSGVLAFLQCGSRENDCSNTGWTVSSQAENCWLPSPFASFPFTSPPVRHRVPSDSVSTLPSLHKQMSLSDVFCTSQSGHVERTSGKFLTRLSDVWRSPHLHFTDLALRQLPKTKETPENDTTENPTNFALGHGRTDGRSLLIARSFITSYNP